MNATVQITLRLNHCSVQEQTRANIQCLITEGESSLIYPFPEIFPNDLFLRLKYCSMSAINFLHNIVLVCLIFCKYQFCKLQFVKKLVLIHCYAL